MNTMPDQETGNRQAARCREMAEKATDERTRNHWMSMAQFWIERAKEKETKVAKVKV